jgi:hypothetical protein
MGLLVLVYELYDLACVADLGTYKLSTLWHTGWAYKKQPAIAVTRSKIIIRAYTPRHL